MKNKGIVIYVGGFELPDKNAAAQRVIGISKMLRDIGYEVILLGVSKTLRKNSVEKNIFFGFTTYSISYPQNYKDWIIYENSIKILKKIIDKNKNVKFIICYNYQAGAFLRAIKYCKKNNIKVVSDCTEWYDVGSKSIIFNTMKKIDVFLRMRIIHKKIDGLILISEYLKNYYKQNNKKLVLPPLVDINDSKWKNKKTSNGETIKLFYAGSPSKQKDNLNIVVDSIDRLSKKHNVLFVVIGISNKEFTTIYNNSVRNKNIIFLGKLPHEKCLDYLKNADFSIVIRDSNRTTEAGFPTKFVESISCGVPVIANSISDISDYISNDRNGVLIKLNELDNEFEQIIKNKKKILVERDIFDYRKYIAFLKEFTDSVVNYNE